MFSEDKNLVENEIISHMYGGEIKVLWSIKNENPPVKWIPKDVLEYPPTIVYQAVKNLIAKNLLKTHEVERKIIYVLSYKRLDEIRFIWFKTVHNKISQKLSPVLEEISRNIKNKIIIKPKWD
ncbi:MAG: hypothetical protein ACTSYR_02840 [Candidatus Odinarchaeia archaeon]